jgi:hypothetical protein
VSVCAQLKKECLALAVKHDGLGDADVCQTFYDEGWWSANVASHRHVIGVHGFTSKLAALRALKAALEAKP